MLLRTTSRTGNYCEPWACMVLLQSCSLALMQWKSVPFGWQVFSDLRNSPHMCKGLWRCESRPAMLGWVSGLVGRDGGIFPEPFHNDAARRGAGGTHQRYGGQSFDRAAAPGVHPYRSG